MNATTARQRSRIYADLARAFSEAEPGLEPEFTRLFLGPGRPVAHPFESVYREGRTMGDTTLAVRRQLIQEGLCPDGRTLPDHVSIELAFLAYLAACEAQAWDEGDADRVRDCLTRQESFLCDHLIVWLPQFCRRVLAGRPHTHYADLARRAETFVAGDRARVRAWLDNGQEEAVPATAERAWWTVTALRGCTLCGICVQVCRPGAIQLIQQEDTVFLRFHAPLCDGCAACQRWCPEGVIDVIPSSERPPDSELARSALLACPRCGQPHAPAAMVAQVQTQVGSPDETLLHRLTLCQTCKASHSSLTRCSTPAGTC